MYNTFSSRYFEQEIQTSTLNQEFKVSRTETFVVTYLNPYNFLYLILFFLGLGQYEAFSFQEDGFLDKQSNKEWAQLDNKKLPELERLTICVWVKLHYHRTHNQVWSYCALKNFILVCSGLSMYKVEYFLKGSLDSILSPSVKIQIMGRKVCLKCKGKILLSVVNKLLKTKSLFTSPNNVLPLYLK